MKSSPLISVVICFLNPGDWLIEAIESVLKQDYTNWELILVDDGSVEKDSAIALAYTQNFPDNIFYKQHENHLNKGLATSRNVGINAAKGFYVAFLDADDYWLPQKLSRQVSLFAKFPEVQMICEASYFWYSWKDPHQKDNLIYIGTECGVYQPPTLMKRLYPLGTGQPPCPSGIIITKKALERCGGFQEIFSGIYQLYEDQAFLSKVYAKEPIYISDEANNYYRKREDSMSSAAGNEKIYKKVRLFYYRWLYNYTRNVLPDNKSILNLLEKFHAGLAVD